MGNVKPWQIILIVVAFGALGFSVWKFGFSAGSEALMANSVIMVDVETGELFEFSLKGRRGVMVPGENPDSGKITLMPVFKQDDGSWMIGERDLPALQYVEATVNVVDRSSGMVSPKSDSPKRISN